ncbi:acylphosphatase [Temperatibacter marinus]|uniref:acylphosphatase n=1 Tax=Temperatibacter marinus TaxID=1456591 RepID=A0AA52H8L5_9PROT|nr:acylphosphatase [Temperatibacter marinus]WND01582.1 acylphosphatase [Temperatibacter marinus]
MNKSVRVWISGKVQGVGYREWAKKEADKLGLHGWVRNRKSGMIESLLYGRSLDVDTLLELYEEGPEEAEVTEVDVDEAKGMCPAYFEIKPEV